ncbi:MAG: hypothetical protein OZSIB_0223 [Candidatus Ozemobacter sibiricus]|uniref:Polysaccharide pyruvyl transferase domain-containing protein n=1 Tax=Candidatus Ozemobacter sibiricus TaxID=2268124 RepID=A0A367ZPP3_9BACT|nr:MAG: hypothetical protein OZSIB_0223 [Candidatus Ozemobacter sibiricus]
MALLGVGFFGEGNLGDEAILEGLLAQVPPPCPVAVTAGRQPLPAPLAARVRTLPRRGAAAWPAFLAELRRAAQVVFTGGLLQDWSVDGVAFYALRLLAASLAGRRPSLWGAGLGPLRSAAARAIAARVLRRVSAAWMRDRASAALFQSLTGRPAHLGCDWSWAIPDPEPPRLPPDAQPVPKELPHPAGAPHPTRVWGINLRPWRDHRFREAARQALHDRPPAALLGLAARQEDAMLLAATFPGLNIAAPASFTDLMRLGRSLAGVWAMRYHVVLAGLRLGLPLMPLAYDDKVKTLVHEIQGPSPLEAANSFSPAAQTRELAAPIQATEAFADAHRQRLSAMSEAFAAFLDQTPR